MTPNPVSRERFHLMALDAASPDRRDGRRPVRRRRPRRPRRARVALADLWTSVWMRTLPRPASVGAIRRPRDGVAFPANERCA
jgi:hypothetical protein